MHVRVIQLFGFIFIVITPIFSEKQKNQKTDITADRRYQNSLIDTFDENLGFFGLFGYDLRDYDNSFVPAGLKHKPTDYITYTGINTLPAINEAVPLVKSYTVPVQFKQPFGISVTARVPVVPFSFRRPVTNIRRPIQVPGIYPLRKEVHSLVPYSLTSKNIPAYNYLLTTKPRMLPHADAEFAKFNFAPIINQGASTGNYIILSGNNKLSGSQNPLINAYQTPTNTFLNSVNIDKEVVYESPNTYIQSLNNKESVFKNSKPLSLNSFLSTNNHLQAPRIIDYSFVNTNI